METFNDPDLNTYISQTPDNTVFDNDKADKQTYKQQPVDVNRQTNQGYEGGQYPQYNTAQYHAEQHVQYQPAAGPPQFTVPEQQNYNTSSQTGQNYSASQTALNYDQNYSLTAHQNYSSQYNVNQTAGQTEMYNNTGTGFTKPEYAQATTYNQ